MADAAYEIQKEEQRKTIEVTTANADIAKQEREIASSFCFFAISV